MKGEIVAISRNEVARTGQAGTWPVLQCTQCYQVSLSSANYCVIYNYSYFETSSSWITLYVRTYSVASCDSTEGFTVGHSVYKYCLAFNFLNLDPVYLAARISNRPCFQSPGDIWRLDKPKWKWARCGHTARRESCNICAIFRLSKHNLDPSLGTLQWVSRRARPCVCTIDSGFCCYREHVNSIAQLITEITACLEAIVYIAWETLGLSLTRLTAFCIIIQRHFFARNCVYFSCNFTFIPRSCNWLHL
jgi:hypothetical protein